MKNSKICLNAMVGSEEATIQRMLDSVVDYIDYYVIQCNGKDKTQEIIDSFFKSKGVPGFTYYVDWNFPGWNRDHTLQECLKADHGCDWILRMDADEQLKVDDDFDWSILNDTSVESWNIVADPGNSLYFRTWMWNANLPWFFQHDKRHETIHLPNRGEGFQRLNLPKSFRHIITNDGDTWMAPMKFITDGLTLELDKVPTRLVLEDYYHLWYIAKSYHDGYRDIDNLPFGKAHSDEYARRVIFYYTQYLNKTHDFESRQHSKYVDDMGYYACILISEAYDWIGDVDNALHYLKTATTFNSRRNEHYVKLAQLYQRLEQWENMVHVTGMLVNPQRPNPFPEFSFLIENSAYCDTGNFCNELHEIALNGLNS
jgi:hypothetical protein